MMSENRPDFYKKKAIFSFNSLELYKYEYCVVSDPPRSSASIKTKKPPKPNPEKKLSPANIARTRREILRLVACNDDMAKFVTLTFRDHITELSVANKLFNGFIKRLTYQYSDLKYLAVPEFTEKGRVHYHFLARLPYVKKDVLASIWSHGFVQINAIKKHSIVGLYISKYISKNHTDSRYFGKKKFFRSTNLLEPVVYYDDDAQELFDILSIKKLQYEANWQTKWLGSVNYSSYSCSDK